MTEKEKRQQRANAEDAVFNKMLLWLVGAVIAEAIVLFVKRFYIEFTVSDAGLALATGLSKFFHIFSYVGFVLVVLGIVWYVFSMKKKLSLKAPLVCTVSVAFIWVLSIMAYYMNSIGVKVMVILPIAAAILILIYFLYHRAFFVNAIVTACGMIALWGARHFSGPIVVIVFVIGWIGLAAIAVLAWQLKKNGGKLGKYQLVCDHKSYPACWLSCAVVFVFTLAGLILGSGAAFYLIYALIGWLFCLAIYYTVKLM